MTALTERRTRLTFETADCSRYRGKLREVVIEAQPLVCIARLKGTRQRFAIAWESIYVHAAKIAAERERAERKARRKERAA